MRSSGRGKPDASATDRLTGHPATHRPMPSRAHNLHQPLSKVPISLIDLHFERHPRMPGVKACDGENTAAQLMHQRRRPKAGLDTDVGSSPPCRRTVRSICSGSEVH